MAYVSKQDKAELAPAIKAVLKKYDMKGSISISQKRESTDRPSLLIFFEWA